MELTDKHFKKLSNGKKMFIGSTTLVFLLIAIIGYKIGFVNVVESYLIFIIGSMLAELVKLNYRVEELEKKKRK